MATNHVAADPPPLVLKLLIIIMIAKHKKSVIKHEKLTEKVQGNETSFWSRQKEYSNLKSKQKDQMHSQKITNELEECTFQPSILAQTSIKPGIR